MAARRTRQELLYRTDGNVAYMPAYEGGAVRVPRQEQEVHHAPPIPKRREKQRTRTLTREQVQVRHAEGVSIFAVVGFFAVGVFAALLMFSYAQLTVATDQMVALRNQVSTLETEYANLTARYEQVFDITRIQAAVNGTMIRPTAEQVVYIDLSEPDRVVLFSQQEGEGGIGGFVRSAEEIVADLVEYFQ